MKVREFERLVSDSRDRLYGYAYYFLGHAEEAEDVVQDAYLRLWSNRSDLVVDGALGWLISVTRNLCRDRLRRRKVRAVVDVDNERVNELPSDGLGPDDHASSAVFGELLKQALAGLPEPQKSIVILREIQEMSYNEICEALDLPLNTVKVYLHRGRRSLRQQLASVVNREAV